MSKNHREQCSSLNRAHSQPRHCEPVTESLVWQSVPLAGRHAVGRLPSFRVQCSMRHSVVADAHIGHNARGRTSHLYGRCGHRPLRVHSGGRKLPTLALQLPGPASGGPIFFGSCPKKIGEKKGRFPLRKLSRQPSYHSACCMLFWYLGRDLTVVLSPRLRWLWPERGALLHRSSSDCLQRIRRDTLTIAFPDTLLRAADGKRFGNLHRKRFGNLRR